MKKMVCEICGSQSIKKENGVFVCQECGTEYSLEEARGLLQEVDSEQVPVTTVIEEKSVKITSENDKYKLLKNLSVWAEYLQIFQAFEEFKFSTTDPSFWNQSVIDVMNTPTIFPDNTAQLNLNALDIYEFCTPKEREFAKSYVPRFELVESDIPWIVENTYHSIRNDFIIHSTGTYLGTTVYKGQLRLDAFPSLYEHSGMASSICMDAKDDDLLKWAKSLLIYVDDEPCKIYEKKVFGGEKLIYDFNAVAKPLKDVVKNKENIYLEDYKNIILPAITERKKELVTVFAKSKEVCALFDLPVMYRDFPVVIYLMNLIMVGKAETWKEAIILYDEEKYRNEVLQKFDELNNTLKQMTTTIANKLDQIGYEITSELRSMELSLSNLNLQMMESNKRLRKISLFTGLTMWNTL